MAVQLKQAALQHRPAGPCVSQQMRTTQNALNFPLPQINICCISEPALPVPDIKAENCISKVLQELGLIWYTHSYERR